MDIFETLKKDHETVAELLDKLESTSARAVKTRQKLFDQLRQELLPHMAAEENYFYPHLLDRTTDHEQRETILEGLEEHHCARTALTDAEEVSLTDERWLPAIKVLKELISHHIEEEESEIFDVAEELIEDADEAAKRFNAAKKEMKVTV